MKIIAIIIILYLMRIGSYYYLHKIYVRSLKRCKKYGTVSTGRKKGYIRGSIVLLSFDSNSGKITYAELLEGSTIFSKFKKFDEIINMTVEEAYDKYSNIKRRESVCQALEFISVDLKNKRLQDDTLIIEV